MYSNITVSLPAELIEYVNIKSSLELSSKSDVVRSILQKAREEEFWKDLLEASRDAKERKTFKGDLDELAEKIIL